MSLEHIDAERILDLISGTIDGGWNDGIEAFVSATNDGETLTVEVEDDDGTKKVFSLSIE
ncbi:hypothetical protein SEA_EVY_128 [Streptomyces phage Evy]|uniref:Uncharacterized protein n=3 Tax=Samistivirus TaxID=2560220 RepID=A0A221SB35_9CAUD|nr:hypothetical protein AXJ18_gp151 [Streptomyces phage Jay2Jay]YP_010103497.1 hypothetical protein KNU67_gp144 [Streptomyces phage Evy]ASN73198.1 hypothetical protein SEA_WARPY_134 [Streptomyces phage Warpy]UEM46909.1 hypothetical protein SEA_TARGARYEN_131 [Streptomyces phage Targaryen]AIW02623.1 hypothetical protein PBI_JAY2JAY_135 [Streptomyces phage Jay2Jay]QDH93988.1 hypothetical protein SEA_EVY_128 [Streptomyces phage Evy]